MDSLLSAIAGLSHAVLQDLDQNNRIAADAELRQQQIDLDLWQQEEMLKFSNRTDYQNFKDDWEKDFAAKYSEYNTKKGPTAYTSQYTAIRGNDMFDRMKLNGDKQLNQVINQQQRAFANAKDENTMTMLNQLAPGQKKADEKAWLINKQVAENRKTPEQAMQELANVYSESVYEMAVEDLNKYMYEHPGATQKEFDDYLNNHWYEDVDVYFERGFKRTFVHADKDKAVNAAKETVQRQLSDMQKQNNNAILTTNTSIIQDCALLTKPETELVSEIKGQINFINATPDLQLTASDRKARLNELYGLLDTYTNKEPGSDTSASSGQVKAFSTLMNQDMHTYIEAAKAGTQSATAEGMTSAYAAKTAFIDYAVNKGREYGIEDNKVRLDYTDVFFEEIQKEYNHDPRVVAVFNQMKYLVKDYSNKRDYNYEELLAETTGYVWDVLFDTDMSKLNSEGIVKQTEKFIENITASELTIQQVKKEGLFGLTGDYDLPKAMQELEGNDYAWTDSKGIQHVDDRAYDVVIDKVIPEQVEALYHSGVTGDLMIDDTPVSESQYDIDLNPQYKDAAGNKYKFVSVDKDNYEIYKNGELLATSEEVKANKKKAKKDVQAEIDVKREKIKQERKALREKDKQMKKNEIQEWQQLAVRNEAPPHIEQNKWARMDRMERTEYLVQLGKEYPEEYKALVKKYVTYKEQ